jgi:imidazolonepropionase-like amidohydrolase
LQIMRDAGLKMAFGSDLLGELRKYHCMEFDLLAKVLTPAEIIRSATVVGAELCRMPGEAGIVAAGAHADLLVVDGDPLSDLSLLQDDGKHLSMIMRGGHTFKDRL